MTNRANQRRVRFSPPLSKGGLGGSEGLHASTRSRAAGRSAIDHRSEHGPLVPEDPPCPPLPRGENKGWSHLIEGQFPGQFVRSLAVQVLVVCLITPTTALAQSPAVHGPANSRLGQIVDQSKLPAGLEGVGIEQRLDEAVPADLSFLDEMGTPVRLGDYFGTRPVILVLAYFRCPMLCTQVLNGLADRLRYVRLEPGEDFAIICVSFDPTDTPEMASAKKASYLEEYGRPGTEAGWHFLTGQQQAIDRLTQAVGFRYRFDPANSQFAHGSTVMLLTPGGHVARYFMGLGYSARDLQLGLIEASQNQISSPVQQLMLYCFTFDGASGKYTFSILNLVRAGGALTVLLLCCTFFVTWRRSRKQPAVSLTPTI